MFKFLKYLPLVGLFKDVSQAYEEEHGAGRPFYLSRRFIGAVIALVGGFAAVQFGVTLDADTLTHLADSTEKLLSAGVALYGAVLAIVGAFKARKK